MRKHYKPLETVKREARWESSTFPAFTLALYSATRKLVSPQCETTIWFNACVSLAAKAMAGKCRSHMKHAWTEICRCFFNSFKKPQKRDTLWFGFLFLLSWNKITSHYYYRRRLRVADLELDLCVCVSWLWPVDQVLRSTPFEENEVL